MPSSIGASASQAENAGSIPVARSMRNPLKNQGVSPRSKIVAWSLSASFRHPLSRFSVAVLSCVIVRASAAPVYPPVTWLLLGGWLVTRPPTPRRNHT